MSTHNICFFGKILNIIPKLSSHTYLSVRLELFLIADSAATSTTDLTGPNSAAVCTAGLVAIREEASTSTTGLAGGTQSVVTSRTSLVTQFEPTKTASLASSLKTASGTWECEYCLVLNKPETRRCMACLSSKRGGTVPEKPYSKDIGKSSKEVT